MDKIKIKQLFADLCCSNCKSDFTEESIQILREEQGLFVIQIVCTTCNKSFGLAFLGLDSIKLKSDEVEDSALKLQIQEGPSPINTDDVIDAHKFIANLDSGWSKYIPEDFKG